MKRNYEEQRWGWRVARPWAWENKQAWPGRSRQFVVLKAWLKDVVTWQGAYTTGLGASQVLLYV